MTKPKTINGFINQIKKLEATPLNDLKGFDKLSDEHKYLIGVLTAEMSNCLGEIELLINKSK